MEKYAVIESGGKQFMVRPGTVVVVERLPQDEGQDVTFERVLAVSDGEAVEIGEPVVEGARVTGKVLGHVRGRKVVVFKKKRRKGYKRKKGHRQELTRVEIGELKVG